MKNLFLIFLFIFSSAPLVAQDKGDEIVTEKYLVSGNCGECKERIEDAAYIKGVKRAEWNKETKMLTVTYRTSKASKEAILKNVAKAGHDSEGATADKKDYQKLPNCCKYRDNACTED